MFSRDFPKRSSRDFFMNHKIVEKKERDRYESPAMEIIEMEVEQPILNGSFTGEDINEWEDM